MSKNIEHKSFPVSITKVDRENGIVDAIVSVMGNIDLGNDIIHNGAFTKTISERAGKIRVLDNHNTNSTTDVIGKPIVIREISKGELPQDTKTNFPNATGGLFTSTQFDMDDENAKKIFNKLANGFIDEWSIGFTVPRGKIDHSNENINGKEIVVRNIREVILYEFSPVIFAMNDATSTVAAKSLEQAETLEDYQKAKLDALEQKEEGLIALINQVILAFDSQGFMGERPEHSNYFVQEVFDNTILVRSLPFSDTPFPFYKIGWRKDVENNQIIFDVFDIWVGGNFAFIPGLKKGEEAEETKQGRVLSQRNFERLEQAVELLGEVLNSAKPEETANEDVVDEEKNNEYDIIDDNSNDETNDLPDPVKKPVSKTREQLLAEVEELHTLINKD